MNRKALLKWAVIAVVLVVAGLAYPRVNGGAAAMPPEVRRHPLFAVYEANFAYQPLTGAVADLNNDGLSDLLIVYAVSREQHEIIAILNGDTPLITPPNRAPIENIKLEFKDIDKTPPLEFIVSGSKGGKFGYAIYRIHDNHIFDIFSADMDDCC